MKNQVLRTIVRLAGVSAVVLTAACGGSASSSLSPTGPSGLSAPSSSGATITGRVNGGSSLSGLGGLSVTGDGALGAQATTSTAGLTVTVEGTTITAVVDGGGTFTLAGLPEGTHRLSFKGPGVDARITVTVGANEQVSLSVTVRGGDARVESEQRSGRSSGQSELEGLVTEVTPGATNTLRVAGTLVTVPASAAIRHGGTTLPFSSIKVGDRVHVRGTRTATGFDATEVNVQNQTGSSLSEVEGVVSGLSGTCPELTFRVGTTTVRTTGTTVFRDGGCRALTDADRVEVRGTRGTDGAISAAIVEIEDDRDDDGGRPGSGGGTTATEVRAEGAVSGKTGTCPALTFMLGTTRVVTNASTRFDGIACTAIADARRVEVRGTRQPNSDLLATKVEPQS